MSYSGTTEPDGIEVVSNGTEVSTFGAGARLDTTAVESLACSVWTAQTASPAWGTSRRSPR